MRAGVRRRGGARARPLPPRGGAGEDRSRPRSGARPPPGRPHERGGGRAAVRRGARRTGPVDVCAAVAGVVAARGRAGAGRSRSSAGRRRCDANLTADLPDRARVPARGRAQRPRLARARLARPRGSSARPATPTTRPRSRRSRHGFLLSLKNEIVRDRAARARELVAPGWTESPMTRGARRSGAGAPRLADDGAAQGRHRRGHRRARSSCSPPTCSPGTSPARS